MSREEQAKYYEKARSERQKHMEMYPHWNARDNYRFGLKKKKRKRDKADDPGTNFLLFSVALTEQRGARQILQLGQAGAANAHAIVSRLDGQGQLCQAQKETQKKGQS